MNRTLRSRTGLGAGALVALCLSAAAAVAQDRPVTTNQNRADTVKIHVNGRVDMDYVQRDRALSGLPGMLGIDDSVNTVEGEIAVRLDVELTEKITGGVEISRARTNDTFPGVVPFFGADIDNMIILRDAHLKASDFMAQGLSVRLGIQNWSFDTRGRGNAFAFDPYHSQSIQRNNLATQDSFVVMGARYGIGSAQELEPVGVHIQYKSGAFMLDLVALPMIAEGGDPSSDEALYAADFWYDLAESMGKGSKIGAIVAVSNIPGSESKFITGGAGANLAFSGGLEIYGEGYFQSGSIADGVDAAGHALQIGGRWTGQDGQFWVELNFTLISGEDGNDADVDNFMSYENVNDLLIAEDMYFGLDIDTNYTAIKVMGGLMFDMGGGKKNMELSLAIGFLTTTEEVTAAGGDEDGIGTEVDVKGKYHLSKQAALVLNIGVLTSSDFLEDASTDDATWLASFGFDLGF